MLRRLKTMMLAAALSLTATVYAGQYEASFSYVQQMLNQSVKNDEAGLNATRQQLESIPKPARQNVKEARALNQQGLDALKQENYQAAATAFQQAQQADPSDVEVAGNLGYADWKLGQHKRAEHQLVYAISLAPGRTSSWFSLGQVYGAMGDAERATGAFAYAYRVSQNRPKTEEFMRQALNAKETDETSRAALKRALQLLGLPLEGTAAAAPPVVGDETATVTTAPKRFLQPAPVSRLAEPDAKSSAGGPYRIAALKAFLFYNQAGPSEGRNLRDAFSDNIIDNPEYANLWNTIIGEGSAKGHSEQTLVMVEVSGNSRDGQERQLRLVATTEGKEVFNQAMKMAILDRHNHFQGAFLLYGTGCQPLMLRATVEGKSIEAKLEKQIKFQCGE